MGAIFKQSQGWQLKQTPLTTNQNYNADKFKIEQFKMRHKVIAQSFNTSNIKFGALQRYFLLVIQQSLLFQGVSHDDDVVAVGIDVDVDRHVNVEIDVEFSFWK